MHLSPGRKGQDGRGYVIGRHGANPQVSFRRYPDALRLGLALGERQSGEGLVLGADHVYRLASNLTTSAAPSNVGWPRWIDTLPPRPAATTERRP
jgi:hypothetical protein